MRRLPVAAAGVVAAIALAACGTIDADKLEDEIANGLGPDLQQLDASVESVSCPDDVDSETGETFDCTVTTDDGTELPVNVEVTNGDNGDVEYKLSDEALGELATGIGKGG